MKDVVQVPSKGIFFLVESSVSQPSASKSPSASSPESHQDPQRQARAKQYSRIKISLGISGTILFFAAILAVLLFGVSPWLENIASQVSDNPYIALLAFAVLLGFGEIILGLPLSYYSGYYLEHKFQLSNQTLLQWAWEGFKGLLVAIPITTPLLLVFYYCLRSFGELWWVPVGTIMFFISVVLARIAPVLIFPLFYKFKALEDANLKSRILQLSKNAGVNVEGIFVFNMSKNTKKANAAFTGIGKSKRIILGDTLVANFTDEEIESVFAHELGHQVVYVPGDSAFNESFATVVEEEGLRRWMDSSTRSGLFENYPREGECEKGVTQLILKYGEELKSLYKQDKDVEEKRKEKARIILRLKEEYEARWKKEKKCRSYASWFAEPINNAKISAVSVYNDLAPAFQKIMEQAGGDLRAFYQRCRALAKKPEEKRNEELRRVLAPAE